MKIHIIGDTHFNHKHIQEYTNRPDGWERKTMAGLLALDTDLLIHLGDVCLGNEEDIHETLTETYNYYKRVLIIGNHDSKSHIWYMNHGWDFVCDNFMLDMFNWKILFTHRPRLDKTQDFQYNVCAHVHNNTTVQLPNHCLLYALENEDYAAVELQKFIIEKRKL